MTVTVTRKWIVDFLYMLFGLGLGTAVSLFLRCHDIVAYVGENKGTVFTFGGLLLTSAIKVAPPPGTPFDVYTFLYDWSHQFFNLPNNRLNPIPSFTPPISAGTLPVVVPQQAVPATTLPKMAPPQVL